MTVTFLLSVPNVFTSQIFKGFIRYPYILVISCIVVARREIIHHILSAEVFFFVSDNDGLKCHAVQLGRKVSTSRENLPCFPSGRTEGVVRPHAFSYLPFTQLHEVSYKKTLIVINNS